MSIAQRSKPMRCAFKAVEKASGLFPTKSRHQRVSDTDEAHSSDGNL